MKNSWQYKFRLLILPGLKRWILFILLGIFTIVFGVLLLLEEHPVHTMLTFTNEILRDAARVLPHKISGIIALSIGAILTSIAVVKLILSILGAYLPDERESIPDVLFRRRHLEKGPKVVVIGGGTGLSTMLKGLKTFTNNITAIVTVGDDGGSSGRLRQDMGVLPPGDIRNCITALADEEKLVTELFHYRFDKGHGLEGHSFGNLFLTAVCAITHGDMLEAARVASRVLNSCGQVLPSTLQDMALIALLEDGSTICGESNIPGAKSRITCLTSEPKEPVATPAAVEAILQADFVILGPGSLYTSVIPNLLVKGIPEALFNSRARKIYVCNLMTQKGETIGYTVSDHVRALLQHAGLSNGSQLNCAKRLIDRVLVSIPRSKNVNQDLKIKLAETDNLEGIQIVRFDQENLKSLGVRAMLREVGSTELPGHHDPERLAQALMYWYVKRAKGRHIFRRLGKEPKVAASL